MIAESMTHTLVIGGTRGMGRGVVRIFLPDGPLSVIGRHTPYVSDVAGGILHETVDITDRDAAQGAILRLVARNGPFDNVVFTHRYRDAGDDWAGHLETGLTAARDIIDFLVAEDGRMSRGSIVFVSSIASAYIVQEQSIGFHISKAATDQLVRYYAVKLGPKGIRVNGINPGRFIKDEARDYYAANEDLRIAYEALSPLGRIGTLDEIVSVVKFLCSAAASYVTGQSLVLDGGLSLHGHDSMMNLAAGLYGRQLS